MIRIKHKLGKKFLVLKSCCQESVSDFFWWCHFVSSCSSRCAAVVGAQAQVQSSRTAERWRGETLRLKTATFWSKETLRKYTYKSRRTRTNSHLLCKNDVSVFLYHFSRVLCIKAQHWLKNLFYVAGVKNDMISAVAGFFRPEFLNRLDEIIATFGDEDVSNVDPVEILMNLDSKSRPGTCNVLNPGWVGWGPGGRGCWEVCNLRVDFLVEWGLQVLE